MPALSRPLTPGRLAPRALAPLVLAAALAAALHADTAPSQEVRALWVTRSSLTSRAAIASLVQSARASGFNTLLVQVRGRGDAYYASALEPRADGLAGQPAAFDPLDAMLAMAHGQGLRVHAWVNVNLVASSTDLPASRDHLVRRRPEWLMVPRALSVELARLDVRSPQYLRRLARWSSRARQVEGLFASPIHPEAADHLVAVVDDLARRYPVDGVHLDYVRFPGPGFDYSRRALTAFYEDLAPSLAEAERRRIDPHSVSDLTALADRFADRWDGFRRSRLNALVIRLRTAVRTRRPDAVFSAAVFPDPIDAASRRYQDWRMWVESGLVDVVCPMAYTVDATTFASQIASAHAVAGSHRVWAGIGAYRLSPAQTVQNIQTARRLGARGIVLFSYDSLVQPPRGAEYLARVGRAAFP